jgi:hypothetical protein
MGDCIEMKGTAAYKIPKLSRSSHTANLKLMVITHAEAADNCTMIQKSCVTEQNV